MNTDKTPFVSIIMPVYNAEKFLKRAVCSIFIQTYSHWELIMVDDCSTDQSAEIMRDLANKDDRVRTIFLSRNKGAAEARNKAIEQAKGRYIAFLDADDEWKDKKLETQICWMQANQIVFSCTAYEKKATSGKTQLRRVPIRANRASLLKNNTIGTLTAIYDAEYFGLVSMPLIRRQHDYGLWLELLTKTEHVYGLDEVLATYHVGHSSLSYNKFNNLNDQWHVFRHIVQLNFFQSLYYFMFYVIHGLRRFM